MENQGRPQYEAFRHIVNEARSGRTDNVNGIFPVVWRRD